MQKKKKRKRERKGKRRKRDKNERKKKKKKNGEDPIISNQINPKPSGTPSSLHDQDLVEYF